MIGLTNALVLGTVLAVSQDKSTLPVLFNVPYIVITDRTDREDLVRILGARSKEELEKLLTNGEFEFRVVNDRYEIWLSRYFPLRMREKQIAALIELERRGLKNLGMIDLRQYQVLIADSLPGLISMQKFPDPNNVQGVTGALSYEKIYTLRRNDGSFEQISIPAMSTSLLESLKTVPPANPNVPRPQNSSRQWTTLISPGPINSLESLNQMSNMVDYLTEEKQTRDRLLTEKIMSLHSRYMADNGLEAGKEFQLANLSSLDPEEVSRISNHLLMKGMGTMDEYQLVGYETVPALIFKMSAQPEGEDATLYIAKSVRLDNPAWKSKLYSKPIKP